MNAKLIGVGTTLVIIVIVVAVVAVPMEIGFAELTFFFALTVGHLADRLAGRP